MQLLEEIDMFERTTGRTLLLVVAGLVAVAASLLGLMAIAALRGEVPDATLCNVGGANLCREMFQHRWAMVGKFHVTAVYLTVELALLCSLVSMTVFSGLGHRDGARTAMHVALVAAGAALVGAMVWTVLAKKASLPSGPAALDCKLTGLMLLAAGLSSVMIGALYLMGVPDVWPWQEDALADRDKVSGLLVGILILATFSLGIGSRVRSPVPETNTPLTAEKLVERVGLTQLTPCDERVHVRDGQLWRATGLPRVEAGTESGQLLALRLDWAHPSDTLRSLQSWAPDLVRWQRRGAIEVMNTLKQDCSTAGVATGAAGTACLLAAASTCVASTAPDKWLEWLKQPALSGLRNLNEFAAQMQAMSLTRSEVCLREAVDKKFPDLLVANRNANNFSMYLQADGRCSPGRVTTWCLNGSFGFVIRGDEHPSVAAGESDRGASAREEQALRACLRSSSGTGAARR